MARGAYQSRSSRQSPFVVFAVAAAILWGILFLVLPREWDKYFNWLVAGGVVTFLFYAFDKLQSKGGGLRVPELVLLLMTLAGGVGGAAVGMLIVRHKTKHMQFWLVLALSAVIHGYFIYRIWGV